MAGLSKRDRGCWLVAGYAPDGTTMAEANDAFNAFVSDASRGFAWFHDHFADRPGGVVLLAVETPEHLEALKHPGPLAGWDLKVHPLIFAEDGEGFLFQADFTTTVYRKVRLRDRCDAYRNSDLFRRNEAREV